ncbi:MULTISPECIES: hypothetical protein [unclassified Kitasatospora]|uniref:hypothetical protein n=1 Tax=unclassified Kitasatospora TaxID=2633591 RepID=UPI0036607AAE
MTSTEAELDAADLATVCRALADLQYVVIPEELIETDYRGPSPLSSHVTRPTWWDRFSGIY